jgi:hypothetical protein
MNIPNFTDTQVVDKNGHFTPQWRQIMSQLMSELQTRMSEESHITPSQTTANIALLNSPDLKGGLLYNSDTNKLNVNINGTFKEVTTS